MIVVFRGELASSRLGFILYRPGIEVATIFCWTYFGQHIHFFVSLLMSTMVSHLVEAFEPTFEVTGSVLHQAKQIVGQTMEFLWSYSTDGIFACFRY